MERQVGVRATGRASANQRTIPSDEVVHLAVPMVSHENTSTVTTPPTVGADNHHRLILCHSGDTRIENHRGRHVEDAVNVSLASREILG